MLQMRLPSFLAFAVALFFFFFFPQFSSPKEDDKYRACSTPYAFDCGRIINVSYPFLAGARPDFCGLPELKLTCEDSVPEFELSSVKYQVKNISYSERLVTLVDKIILDDRCPRKSTYQSIAGFFFEFSEGDSRPTTLVTGCSTAQPSEYFGILEVSCPEVDNEKKSSYLFPDVMDKSLLENWGCSDIVEVRLPAAAVQVDRIYKDPSSFMEVMKEGVEVRWKVGDGWCTDCQISDGVCPLNQSSHGNPACFCPDGSQSRSCSSPGKSKSKSEGAIIGVSAAAAIGILAVVGIIFFCYRRKRHVAASSVLLTRKISRDGSSTYDLEKSSTNNSMHYPTHVFSYKELEEATNNFDESRELGDGGFGTVYYGKLKDGRAVAVKRLYENNYKRVEQFLNEVHILSSLRHQNLVSLYGCTSRHSRELLLVYEYIPNGTVADHLHGDRAKDSSLTWPVRLSIAVETAEALSYLHAIDPPIIHRDVKTNNILLDNNFRVKVADFGLSRLFPLDVTHVSTTPQGTPGYVDPDYHKCYQLTDKSDVYSFGVVLAELISSQPAVDITRHRHEINLAMMAINKIQSGALGEFVDPALGYHTDFKVSESITCMAELTFSCLREEKDDRPSMEEVVKELHRIARRANGVVTGTEEMDNLSDDVGLLKNIPPRSPDSVMDPWGSKLTTPNTSS